MAISVTTGTPEEIALRLMECIAVDEKKKLGDASCGHNPDREWILSTYGECLLAVAGNKATLADMLVQLNERRRQNSAPED